jgi:Salmonella virulence plasmid 65kDa B protein/FG-GAP-like repeat/Insecticide toxin TcdB middle/N-terminal region
MLQEFDLVQRTLKNCCLVVLWLLWVPCQAATPPAPNPPPRDGAKSAPAPDVNQYNAEFRATIPVKVPGFRGMEPNIELKYGSGGGNSFVGMGWTLSAISFVQRASVDFGSPRYNATDRYYLDGEELVADKSLGGDYSVKIKDFRRISFDARANQWQVRQKDGTLYLYSSIHWARNREIGGVTSDTFRWYLTRVTDIHGNDVNYSYFSDNIYDDQGVQHTNDLYLDKISYNGTTIQFVRTIRIDELAVPTGSNLYLGHMRYRLAAIKVSVGSDVARAYELIYASSLVNEQSLLKSVQEYGRNAVVSASGSVTGPSLPLTSMAYQNTPHDFGSDLKWGDLAKPDDPFGPHLQFINDDGTSFYTDQQTNARPTVGDFDGDGKMDVLQCSDAIYVSRSTGSSFAPSTAWLSGKLIGCGRGSFRVADVSGDGKSDLIVPRSEAFATSTDYWNEWWLETYVSTGSSFVLSKTSAHTRARAAFSDSEVLADFNGDGKVDLASIEYNEASSSASARFLSLYLSDGGLRITAPTGRVAFDDFFGGTVAYGGNRVRSADFNGDGQTDIAWLAATGIWVFVCEGNTFSAPVKWSAELGDDENTFFADYNGDGRADVAYFNKVTNQWRVYESSGAKFMPGVLWGTDTLNNDALDELVQVDDFNGDGLADILHFDYGKYYILLSNRTKFLAPEVWYQDARSQNFDVRRFYYGDFTGDGKTDILRMSRKYGIDSSAGDRSKQLWVLPAPSLHPNLLSKLTRPMGASVSATYLPSSIWDANYLPVGMVVQTVRRLTTDDGRGHPFQRLFSYQGALWANQERRFLGFRKVTSGVDVAGNYMETYYLQTAATRGEAEYLYYRKADDGTPTANRIYGYKFNKYSVDTAAPYTTQLLAAWDYRCELQADCRADGQLGYVEYTYDNYNNTTLIKDWGDYYHAGDERNTRRWYTYNTDNFLVSLPRIEQTREGLLEDGALKEYTVNYYDNAALNTTPPTKGNLTRIDRWLNLPAPASFLSTLRFYDVFGNMWQENDPRNNAVRITYDDTYHLFPVRECRPLGNVQFAWCSETQWDTVLGLPTKVTDLQKTDDDTDNASNTTTYDAFGRTAVTSNPTGDNTWTYYLNYGNPGTQYTRIATEDGTADNLNVYQYYDGLGRVYKEVREGGFIRDTEFSEDSERVWRQSFWHTASEPVRWTTNSYDGLKRLRTTTHPDDSNIEIVMEWMPIATPMN